MNSAIEHDATQCPRCDADLAYQLDVADGGGLRYEVSCPPCGEVYFEMNAPLRQVRAAA